MLSLIVKTPFGTEQIGVCHSALLLLIYCGIVTGSTLSAVILNKASVISKNFINVFLGAILDDVSTNGVLLLS